MVCHNCGAQIGPSSQSCWACGARVGTGNMSLPSQTAGKYRSSAKVWLVCVGAFFVLLIAYAILTPNSKTLQSPATSQSTPVAQPAAGTWDGIEGHPDCTPNGHQDPHDPGVTITDLDTENCPKGLLGSIKSESSITYEVPSDVDDLADDVELLGKDITDDYFAGKITASQMNHISKQMKIAKDDVYEGKHTGDFTKARTQLTKVKQMEMDAEKY